MKNVNGRLEKLEQKVSQDEKYLIRVALDALSGEEVDAVEKMKHKSDEGYTEEDLEREFGEVYRNIKQKMDDAVQNA